MSSVITASTSYVCHCVFSLGSGDGGNTWNHGKNESFDHDHRDACFASVMHRFMHCFFKKIKTYTIRYTSNITNIHASMHTFSTLYIHTNIWYHINYLALIWCLLPKNSSVAGSSMKPLQPRGIDFVETLCGWNLLGGLCSPGAASFAGLSGYCIDQWTLALPNLVNVYIAMENDHL